MTDEQWDVLLGVIDGQVYDPLPMGFIIDCPWLPNWYGATILDYFTSDEIWMKANLKAIETFPECMFLPGFWSEYGMCSEPSAFGAKCLFFPNDFPSAQKSILAVEHIDMLETPHPETDGLAPFILNRLKLNRQKIEAHGHKIRFSVSRGPLNIASYLMGTEDFLIAMKTDPERIHKLLRHITDYLIAWHDLQQECFASIDGIFLLDDMIGFINETDFKQFCLPYLKEIYSRDVHVKFLHNDAQCRTSLPYLQEIGINLFNMAFDTDLNELKRMTGNKVTMLGNIPPRDVLANGTEKEVAESVRRLLEALADKSRVIVSCGGGMPPQVKTGNIRAFIKAVQEYHRG
jgi:uroporphyrinogen-III decarboxylase